MVTEETNAQWFDILEANKRISNSEMRKILRTIVANKDARKKKIFMDDVEKDTKQEFPMEEVDFRKLTIESIEEAI